MQIIFKPSLFEEHSRFTFHPNCSIPPTQNHLQRLFVAPSQAPCPIPALGKRQEDAAEDQAAVTPTPPTAVDAADLCVGAGVGTLLDKLFFCMASPGDGVLVTAPYYSAFDNDVTLRNGVHTIPVYGDEPAKLPTARELDAALRQAAGQGCAVKAILVTNPGNPCGGVSSPAELAAVFQWALAAGMHIAVDEVYASSVYKDDDAGNGFVSALALGLDPAAPLGPRAASHLHVVYGLSKDFCAAGLRVGVLHTRNSALQRALDNVNFFCCLPGPMQFVVARMLEDTLWVDDYLAENKHNLAAAQRVLTAALADADVPFLDLPSAGGMFVWVDLSAWLREQTWAEEARLWQACVDDPACKLVMTPGRDFKSEKPGCFRLCFAAVSKTHMRETLTTGVRRLAAFLSRYGGARGG